jgi:hypothetical protein
MGYVDEQQYGALGKGLNVWSDNIVAKVPVLGQFQDWAVGIGIKAQEKQHQEEMKRLYDAGVANGYDPAYIASLLEGFESWYRADTGKSLTEIDPVFAIKLAGATRVDSGKGPTNISTGIGALLNNRSPKTNNEMSFVGNLLSSAATTAKNAVVTTATDYVKQKASSFVSSELTNFSDGIGIGQPYLQGGQVKVPTQQSGEGIFSGLQNYLAPSTSQAFKNTGVAGPNYGQILSQPAAAVSGQQQIVGNGQVVLTGGVSVGKPVTMNTTDNSNGQGDSSIVWFLGAAVVLFLILTGGIKKLFS